MSKHYTIHRKKNILEQRFLPFSPRTTKSNLIQISEGVTFPDIKTSASSLELERIRCTNDIDLELVMTFVELLEGESILITNSGPISQWLCSRIMERFPNYKLGKIFESIQQ